MELLLRNDLKRPFDVSKSIPMGISRQKGTDFWYILNANTTMLIESSIKYWTKLQQEVSSNATAYNHYNVDGLDGRSLHLLPRQHCSAAETVVWCCNQIPKYLSQSQLSIFNPIPRSGHSLTQWTRSSTPPDRTTTSKPEKHYSIALCAPTLTPSNRHSWAPSHVAPLFQLHDLIWVPFI